MYEIDPADKATLKKTFFIPTSQLQLIVFALPALAGFLLHLPLYFAARFATGVFFDNDHYDSVVVSLLMLAYPLYLALVMVLAGLFLGWFAALLVFVLLPFLAWACLRWKHQLDYT